MTAANEHTETLNAGDFVITEAGTFGRDAIVALVAELDRYREALERIYRTGKGVHVEIAREALNRG